MALMDLLPFLANEDDAKALRTSFADLNESEVEEANRYCELGNPPLSKLNEVTNPRVKFAILTFWVCSNRPLRRGT